MRNSTTAVKYSAATMYARRDSVVLILLGALLAVLAVRVASCMDLGDGFIFFLGGYFAMFVVYLAAVYFTCVHSGAGKGRPALVFAVSLLLRLPFLFSDPALSDDIYRYVWDGRVQHQGINPYRYPPQAPQLRHLRDRAYENVNNKDLPTIYPPLMQLVFAASTAVSERAMWMKGIFVLADLFLIGILTRLIEAMDLDPTRALIYAWNPLVVVEIAGSGHNDVLALAFLISAHGAILHKRDILSICFLAASGLTKLMGFILAPLFARWVRPAAWLSLPALALVVSLPYLGVGSEAFLGLLAYGARWRANDSLFHILFLVTGSLDVAKAIAAGLFAGLLAVLILRKVPPLRGCYLAIGAILLLAATVHPWYLVWIVPYLCIYPNPGWLLLTGTVVLSYHAPFLSPPGERWAEQGLYKLLEYGPFFAIQAVWALSPRRPPLGERQSSVL